MSVFVFDGERKFVGRWDENDNTRFGTDYRMPVPLQPGNYSFVVWGGLKDENYYLGAPAHPYDEPAALIPGQTTMSDIVVRLTCDTREGYGSQKHYVDYAPSPLFFGRTTQLTLDTGTDNTVTVDLVRNSKQVNLTVVGLPGSGTRSNPYPHIDIYVDSPNGGYDFWNGAEQYGRELTWVQHNAVSGGTDVQASTIHSLKMVYGNTHTLTIHNAGTGKTLYTADLLEDYISKVPEYASQDAVDSEEEFDITVDLRSDLGVSVTVNGWDVGLSGNIIQ